MALKTITKAIRVLPAERISHDRKDSWSIERQDTALRAHAEARIANGEKIQLLEPAQDRTVSGDMNMYDRPALGKWLTPEGLTQWDELWVTKQDRLSRNDMHFMAFVFKILEWGKVLVVLDDPGLDLTTPEGRAIAHVKAIGPHRELENIRTRVLESHEQRRWSNRWHGGIPGFGYTTVTQLFPMPNGSCKEGMVLVLDDYMTSVGHEVRRWMIEGESFLGVARRLNDRGELTVKDLWRVRHNLKPLGTKWTSCTVKAIFTSLHCLGIKLNGGQPMYDRDGSPFVIAAPMFTELEWSSLQTAIKKRERVNMRVAKASPFLGVCFCGKCGKSALRLRTTSPKYTKYGYYRCSKQPNACSRVLMREETVTELIERAVLDEVGSADVPRKEWSAGSDATAELAELERRIKRMRDDRDAGHFDDDEAYYHETMSTYTKRRKELRSIPTTPAGWVCSDSGRTFAQVWHESDEQARRRLVLDAGIKFVIYSANEWEIVIPDDIRERVSSGMTWAA
jgi:DNA invertase Pin-like site-specific DNA recombinase